jgi:hypothetical protein
VRPTGTRRASETHLTFNPAFPPIRDVIGSARRASFSGFIPHGSRPPLQCVLGLQHELLPWVLLPFRACLRKPWPGLLQPSSHVLDPQTDCSAWKPAPQSVNQLTPSALAVNSLYRRRGQPSWDSCTYRLPCIRAWPRPGYVFTSRRKQTLLLPRRRSWGTNQNPA